MKHLFSIFKISMNFLLCLCLLVHLTSCGTILYPERRGLARDPAQIDVGVVVMDGALLLLFVLPGVIAYAVDFATGCIYLPPGQMMQNIDDVAPGDIQVIHVAPERLNLDTLSGIVQQHTGVASNSADMRIFRPDSADINIQQELALLLNGQTLQSQGIWYAGDQITLVANTDGRTTNVGLVVPMEVYLAGK